MKFGEIGSRTKKLQAKSKTTRSGKHPPPSVLIGLIHSVYVLLQTSWAFVMFVGLFHWTDGILVMELEVGKAAHISYFDIVFVLKKTFLAWV